ncbi:flavin reductase (DIM6/NTAB) family NADH-FMN oxidoreductase RutF [Saccharothrix carnea]|uniref:Flavin reductase (DIM6/NTAB) family NADH-FMN oxidoreductase RutF n=1 Tax=Saccharothrix carnea TaxID=1280637 RepID=A0A2P8I0C8_SACCR|nr:flavin reductase family protein [Saccharothrix carnea]PSL51926.1 flavin reductase (DIM6/NTAB) family NADH-FMN oxidoreductase RutF [Saccharothrix carnea]
MSEKVHVIHQGIDRADPAQAPPGQVAPSDLRSVMGRFATGVVVITVGGEHIHGMTANTFGSVSLDPPLVQCCIAHTAVMHGALSAAGRFGVSVMGAGQESVVRYFADRARPLGEAQFDVVDSTPGPHTGAPLLTGALAWLECEVVEAHVAGDHSLFVGRVLSCEPGDDDGALLFYRGRFHQVVTG